VAGAVVNGEINLPAPDAYHLIDRNSFRVDGKAYDQNDMNFARSTHHDTFDSEKTNHRKTQQNVDAIVSRGTSVHA
jgi:hypothetical protein